MATLIPTSISDVIAIAESRGYTMIKNGRKVDVTYPNASKVYSYSGSILTVALRLEIITEDDSDRIRHKDDRYLQPIATESKSGISTVDHIAKLEARIPTLRVGSPIHKAQLALLAELKAKLA